MALDPRFQPDYPAGLRVWLADQEVAGNNPRLGNGRRFARGREQAVVLAPEPANPHDRNAIKVMGVYKG